MLYVSTRNNQETYTAFHPLSQDQAPDGGHYVPMGVPEIRWDAFAECSPNEMTASLLNQLFQTQLSKWDVDFAIGRHPIRTAELRQRISVMECWHNLDWNRERLCRNLSAQLKGTRNTEPAASEWMDIAAGICGIFGTLVKIQDREKPVPVDIALASGNLALLMSAWYARAWGAPVGNIICCCNENNSFWELMTQGVLRTDANAVITDTPACDWVVAPNLERLIYAAGGCDEAVSFAACIRDGRNYYPGEEVLRNMRQGIHVSVISQKRLQSTVLNAHATHGYVFVPYSALAYAGLMDYRAKTGESRPAVILSERGALCDDGFVASALGISVDSLHQILQ